MAGIIVFSEPVGTNVEPFCERVVGFGSLKFYFLTETII